jgi:hypothetical protein
VSDNNGTSAFLGYTKDDIIVFKDGNVETTILKTLLSSKNKFSKS